METRDFLRIMSKICANNSCADNCPLKFFCSKSFGRLTEEVLRKVEKAVEEWMETHPAKTRQTEFLKKFPNVMVAHGTIDILPCSLDKSLAEGCDGGEFGACANCKEVYWNEEVE